MPDHSATALRSALPAPAGVPWWGLIVAALGLLLVLGGATAGAGWWAWQHLVATLPLGGQRADIALPQNVRVDANVTNTVRVKLDHQLAVRVPIAQELSIPITDPLALQVQLDAEIPIALDVPVKQVLHIDQSYELDTTVQAKVWGMTFDVPVRARVPLKADIPIDLMIPVRKQLPLSLNLPATVRVLDPIKTRIDTVFDVKVPVRAQLALPVTAPVSAQLHFADPVMNVGIEQLNARIPLQTLQLTRR